MSALDKFSPTALLSLATTIIFITVFSPNPAFGVISLFSGICFYALLGRYRAFFSDLCLYVLMILVVTMTNPLFSRTGQPILFLFGNPITLEALKQGFFMSIMIVAVILWCKLIFLSLTGDKILFLAAKTTPKISVLLSVTLSYIPRFRRGMQRQMNAQKTLGLQSGRNYFARVKHLSNAFSHCVGLSLESSIETANSMEARGFGLKERSSFGLFSSNTRDVFVIAFCLVILLIFIAVLAAGQIDFSFFPRASELPLNFFAIVAYTAFFSVCILPTIYQLKEKTSWK